MMLRNAEKTRLCGHHVAAALIFMCFAASAQSIRTDSAWDRQLSFLALKDVDSKGASAPEAWQEFSSAYGVRSVLFFKESDSTAKPFTFQRKECIVLDWFDAFCEAYELRRHEDPATGVNWLLPAETNYEDVLSIRVFFDKDSYALPVMSAVLAGFADSPVLQKQGVYISPGGWAFERSMDFPMDIPEGSHSLRDILNLACLSNPMLTFAAVGNGETTNLMPANVLLDLKNRPNAGILLFWETEIGRFDGGEPSKSLILDKLADQSAHIRWAARLYLAVMSPALNATKWLEDRSLEEQKALWLSLALLSIYVRDEQVSHEALSAPLRRVAKPAFFESARPDLAFLAALELARLTEDTSGVEAVSKRQLSDKALEDLTADVARISRASETVWHLISESKGGLQGVNSQWTAKVAPGSAVQNQKLSFTFETSVLP